MSTTNSVPQSGKQPLSSEERSAVFSAYNRLRHEVEPGRANRALGLVQSGEERPYRTTADFCSCPDWQYRIRFQEGGKCKHQLQLELAAAVDVAQGEATSKPEPEEEPASEKMSIDEINDLLFG